MQLSLYQYYSCAYCGLVRRAIDGLDLEPEIELRDIHESSARRGELVEATGRMTVPCLRIESDDGSIEWMHESSRIIQYLEELAR